MTTFLLDIWHDLREKRLWPVAVGLLVATIVVPVVLFKPAAGAPKNQAPIAGDTAALPVVALDHSSIDNSALGTFDVKNPFASSKDKTSGTGTGTTGASGVATGGTGGSLGDSLFGGGGGGSGSSSGGGTAGGSGGTVPGSSGGSGGTRYFTYTVDVSFGPRGKAKKYAAVESLDLLPDETNPVVSFMGMSDGAKTAVFFVVDPAVQAEGEGDCNPTPEDCRFVYLKVDDAQNEQTLSSAEGQVEYSLRLDAIHTKTLTEGEATGDSTPAADTPASEKRRQDYNLATHPKLTFGGIR